MEQSKLEENINKRIKESKLSRKTLKHLETLKHYYKVDIDNKIITVPLHFDSIDELIDTSIGDKSHPAFNREILNKISDIAHTIPYEFYINVDLKIDDYKGYNHETISNSIIDAFEMFHFDMVKEKNFSAIKVVALIVIGILVFTWLFYICSKKWFGEAGDPNHDTLHELVYTIAAVVLWEAVYIIFLPDDSFNGISYDILYSINNISLLDKSNKVLDVITSESMNKVWKIDSRAVKRRRKFLLIMGTVLICTGVTKTTQFVDICLINTDILTKTLTLVLTFILILMSIIAGIGGISYFRDKGPFKKFLIAFGFINSGLVLLELILCIVFYYDGLIKIITMGSISFVISLIYSICAIRLRKKDI